MNNWSGLAEDRINTARVNVRRSKVKIKTNRYKPTMTSPNQEYRSNGDDDNDKEYDTTDGKKYANDKKHTNDVHMSYEVVFKLPYIAYGWRGLRNSAFFSGCGGRFSRCRTGLAFGPMPAAAGRPAAAASFSDRTPDQ